VKDGVQHGGAHSHLDGFLNKQNMKFRVSENPHRVVETSLHLAKCTIYCVVSKQRLSGLIFVEGIVTNQQYL
jgi:hypothetical protein